MKKLLLGLLLANALLAASPALAQAPPIIQSGQVTPGHAPFFISNGIVADAGTATQGFLTSLGITAQGPGICQNSGAITGPYNQLCFNVTGTGGGFIFNNIGGATGAFGITVNGVSQNFVTAVVPTTPNGQACFNDTIGTVTNCSGGGGTALVVGGTTITSGTGLGLLYNAGGVLGNLATANNSIFVTDGSGNPSLAGVLPFVVTAATGGTGVNNGSSTITVGGAFSTSAALAITAGTTNQIAVWNSGTTLGGASTLPFTVTTPTGGTGQVSFTSNLPLIGNGASAIGQGTVSGNTTVFATANGALTSGHCVSIDGSGNFVDAGGSCTTGGAGGTVASSTIGQVPIYTGATIVTGSPAMTFAAGTLTLGTANTTLGTVIQEGSTSGAVTIAPQAAAGTPTITWGTGTGTPAVTASAPLALSTATGNLTVTGAAGQVLAGAGPAFTRTPVLGTAASAAGTLGVCNGSAGGACVTVQNLGATSAYNKNIPATAGALNQINTSGGGVGTSEAWTNIASLLTAGAGVGVAGTTNATISCVVSTAVLSGCVKPDGSSITIAAGVLSGAVFIFYPQCTLNGTVDCSAAINTAITSCGTAGGGKIILPVGTILVNTGVSLTQSACDLGGGGTYQEFTGTALSPQLATNFPTQGTVLYQTSTANCAITAGGAGVNHVRIHDIAFRTNQPADTNGFSPTAYKPSICLASQTDIERVFFWNVYTGIQVGTTGTQATGRTRITNISGTCFNICVDVQFSADFGWINDTECAPFSQMPGGVTTGQNEYVSTHSTCISLERVDEWTLHNINAFSVKNGIVENHTSDGDANWVHVDDYHCDGCQQGILINGCAQMTFSNVLILGTGTIAGSVGVNLPGPQFPVPACTTGNNILTFSNLNIHGPGNQCVAANTVDFAVTNYECFAFNGAATGTAGTTMNVAIPSPNPSNIGSIFTVGGRYNVNNQGNTGGGGGGAQSGSGTFFTSHAN